MRAVAERTDRGQRVGGRVIDRRHLDAIDIEVGGFAGGRGHDQEAGRAVAGEVVAVAGAGVTGGCEVGRGRRCGHQGVDGERHSLRAVAGGVAGGVGVSCQHAGIALSCGGDVEAGEQHRGATGGEVSGGDGVAHRRAAVDADADEVTSQRTRGQHDGGGQAAITGGFFGIDHRAFAHHHCEAADAHRVDAEINGLRAVGGDVADDISIGRRHGCAALACGGDIRRGQHDGRLAERDVGAGDGVADHRAAIDADRDAIAGCSVGGQGHGHGNAAAIDGFHRIDDRAFEHRGCDGVGSLDDEIAIACIRRNEGIAGGVGGDRGHLDVAETQHGQIGQCQGDGLRRAVVENDLGNAAAAAGQSDHGRAAGFAGDAEHTRRIGGRGSIFDGVAHRRHAGDGGHGVDAEHQHLRAVAGEVPGRIGVGSGDRSIALARGRDGQRRQGEAGDAGSHVGRGDHGGDWCAPVDGNGDEVTGHGADREPERDQYAAGILRFAGIDDGTFRCGQGEGTGCNSVDDDYHRQPCRGRRFIACGVGERGADGVRTVAERADRGQRVGSRVESGGNAHAVDVQAGRLAGGRGRDGKTGGAVAGEVVGAAQAGVAGGDQVGRAGRCRCQGVDGQSRGLRTVAGEVAGVIGVGRGDQGCALLGAQHVGRRQQHAGAPGGDVCGSDQVGHHRAAVDADGDAIACSGTCRQGDRHRHATAIAGFGAVDRRAFGHADGKGAEGEGVDAERQGERAVGQRVAQCVCIGDNDRGRALVRCRDICGRQQHAGAAGRYVCRGDGVGHRRTTVDGNGDGIASHRACRQGHGDGNAISRLGRIDHRAFGREGGDGGRRLQHEIAVVAIRRDAAVAGGIGGGAADLDRAGAQRCCIGGGEHDRQVAAVVEDDLGDAAGRAGEGDDRGAAGFAEHRQYASRGSCFVGGLGRITDRGDGGNRGAEVQQEIAVGAIGAEQYVAGGIGGGDGHLDGALAQHRQVGDGQHHGLGRAVVADDLGDAAAGTGQGDHRAAARLAADRQHAARRGGLGGGLCGIADGDQRSRGAGAVDDDRREVGRRRVAGEVGDGDRRRVAAIGERIARRHRHGPGAGGIGGGGVGLAVERERHGRIGLGDAAQRRGVVVAGVVADQAGIVGCYGAQAAADRRCLAVDGERRAVTADDIAGRIGEGDGRRVGAVRQCGGCRQGDRISAAGIGHRAVDGACERDQHYRAGRGGAGDRRAGEAGEVVTQRAAVVAGNWRQRAIGGGQHRVQQEIAVVAVRRGDAVAGGIGGHGGDLDRAIAEHEQVGCGECHRLGCAGVADDLGDAAGGADEGHHRSAARLAADGKHAARRSGRSGCLGGVADRGDRDHRCERVDADLEAACGADHTRTRGFGGGDGVQAFRQGLGRGDGPIAVDVHRGGQNLARRQGQGDAAAGGRTLAREGRRAVAGDAVALGAGIGTGVEAGRRGAGRVFAVIVLRGDQVGRPDQAGCCGQPGILRQSAARCGGGRRHRAANSRDADATQNLSGNHGRGNIGQVFGGDTAFRHIFVEETVFGLADQRGAAALANIEVFQHQIGCGHLGAREGDMQVIAHSLDADVVRRELGFIVHQLDLCIARHPDLVRRARRPLRKLEGLDSACSVVDDDRVVFHRLIPLSECSDCQV